MSRKQNTHSNHPYRKSISVLAVILVLILSSLSINPMPLSGMIRHAGSVVLHSAAEETADTEFREVPFSDLSEGDRIVIGSDNYQFLMSRFPAGIRLGAASANANYGVITDITRDTAVFTVHKKEDGSFTLKEESGWLVCDLVRNGILLEENEEKASRIYCEEDGYLFAKDAEDKRKNLEYYRRAGNFSIYETKTLSEDFRLRAFRVPESWQRPEPEGEYWLPVFETSDVHGNIAWASEEEFQYRLAYISARINEERSRTGEYRKDRVVLLDGGDILTGNIMSTLLEGEPLFAAYAAMDYDAVTVGNHEFDRGLEAVIDPDQTLKDYAFYGQEGENMIPVICSNLYRNGKRDPITKDYVVLEKTACTEDGKELPVRIGVVGFASNYGDGIKASLFKDRGYAIKADYEALNALASRVKEEEACDAMVLLVHGEAPQTAWKIREDSVFDLVLGGHSHLAGSGETDTGLNYAQTGANAANYMSCRMNFTEKDGHAVFTNIYETRIEEISDRGELLEDPENTEALDPKITAITNDAASLIMEYLKVKIGTLHQDVDRYAFDPESGGRASSAGNWIASLMRRGGEAEIGFMNSAGLREDIRMNPDTGTYDLTIEDIYGQFPFENQIYVFDLSYEELLKLLQYSLTNQGKILYTNMVGIDCYFTRETVNALVREDGTCIYENGTWKGDWKDRRVRVAMNDYIATTQRINRDDQSGNPTLEWMSDGHLISDTADSTKTFIDELTKEAEKNNGELTIDPLPHFLERQYRLFPAEEDADYRYVWTKGSDQQLKISFTPFAEEKSARIVNLAIDGQPAGDGHISEAGQDSFTLDASLLESLAEGDHTLDVQFAVGQGKAVITVLKEGQTPQVVDTADRG